MTEQQPQPAPDVRPTEHRTPAPTPAEQTERMREQRPGECVSDH